MSEPPASLSATSLRLAGHVGQVTLDRMRDASAACVADFDQHVAAVRAELTAACQLPSAGSAQQADLAAHRTAARAAVPVPPAGTYASCPDLPFVSSAVCAEPVLPRNLLLHYACGFIEAALSSDWRPSEARPSEARGGSDWGSMRLAAICHLVTQAEAADALHPDLRAL